MEFFPDLLTFENGKKVQTAEAFAERRKELVDILSRRAYGYVPPAPKTVELEKLSREETCAGFAEAVQYILHADTEFGEVTFPLHTFEPTDGKKHPFIVMLNFRADTYDKYYPAEEIINMGFTIAVVNYKDVTSDDGDFTSGIAAAFPRDGKGTDPSKISLWAWAASRIIDAFWDHAVVDNGNIAVAGHSRLGKTSLWCAANDERIKYVFDNNSGCMGDSLEQTRHEGGETQQRISEVFPFWFCDNFNDDVKNGRPLPFDQHFLIAACAPRYVFVGSAALDNWADQYSQQLGCIAASPAWEICGKKGFVGSEAPANVGDSFREGEICYHLRSGKHFFSRADWVEYLESAKEKM